MPFLMKFTLYFFTLCVLLLNPITHAKNLPRTMNYSAPLTSELASALASKGADYVPRTKHLTNGNPDYTNRLILEDSPYLLQHAHNPVNWYPWGKEAFAAAKKENKPVFLSIGYATCHWCHVMEEESFESIGIAEILNTHFIAIKVDREQYPDIDQTYMTAVTMVAGQGGWPMSSFLTYEGKPFFGGTYFPPASFTDLLLKVHQAWKNHPQEIFAQAEKLADAVRRANSTQEQVSNLELTAVQSAIDSILAQYDAHNGGFSPAPKFPNEPLLLLLLQAAHYQPHKQLKEALMHTLSAMAQGGIYDQIGGGFHRYSTDNQWLVPHFEKMLYNQAYLARIYAQAYRLTGNPLYARVARQTLDYVLREMTTASGSFYSATDADSEGHEGTYFIWSEEEINSLLNTRDAALIINTFGITGKGNFEGKNILYLPHLLPEVAKKNGLDITQLLLRLDPLLETLRKYRETRIPPLTDNKVIVAWNGMLMTALAEAGLLLNEPLYIKSAERAADALWKSQRPKAGILWRVNLDGKASIAARQGDYVHFIEALLALYDVTGNPVRLQQAQALTDEMLNKFLDKTSATLNMGQDELLFTQPKDSYDGALPSGNAVAVRVLSRLAKRTGDPSYADSAAKILQAFSGSILRQPAAYSYMLAQLSEIQNGEIGVQQYAARGALKIDSHLYYKKNNEMNLAVEINIADGWYINANRPLQETLVATAISLLEDADWQLQSVAYPKPTLKKMRYEETPLALYQHKVLINATLSEKSHKVSYPLHLNLQLQACNQQSCLPPETIILSNYKPYK
jgi:uncharacterized protein